MKNPRQTLLQYLKKHAKNKSIRISIHSLTVAFSEPISQQTIKQLLHELEALGEIKVQIKERTKPIITIL